MSTKVIESGAHFQPPEGKTESSTVGVDGRDERYSPFPPSKRVPGWPWRLLARLRRGRRRVEFGQVL
jgi:hypothetical protein